MRVLRILGLGMVSAFLVLAVTAAAAPAAFQFQAGEYSAEVSGQQVGEHVLTVEAGITLKCKVATVVGELAEAEEELEVTPSYSECVAAGFVATVATEGCKYRLDANTNDADVVCPAGKAIKITAGTCELQVGSQNGRTSVEYDNSPEALPPTATAKAALTGVVYTKSKDGFLCPLLGTGTKEDGTLTGEYLVKAVAAEGQVAAVFAEPLWEFCVAEPEWPEEDCGAWKTGFEEPEEEEEAEWPEEEEPAEEEQKGHNPILFIHGFNGSKATFATFVKWFEGDGWAPKRLHNWAYNSGKSNIKVAERVSTEVNKFLTETGAKTVDIVTHSMGGLSGRYYVKNLGGDKKVDDFVSIGGPNHGTWTALLCWDFFNSCKDMLPKSKFLNELNAGGDVPGGIRYGTWGSECDKVIRPPHSVTLTGAAQNKMFTKKDKICPGHTKLHEEKTIYEEVRDFVKN
jgi:Lipase (class 2)